MIMGESETPAKDSRIGLLLRGLKFSGSPIVERVETDGIAHDALLAGDTVLSINGAPSRRQGAGSQLKAAAGLK